MACEQLILSTVKYRKSCGHTQGVRLNSLRDMKGKMVEYHVTVRFVLSIGKHLFITENHTLHLWFLDSLCFLSAFVSFFNYKLTIVGGFVDYYINKGRDYCRTSAGVRERQ